MLFRLITIGPLILAGNLSAAESTVAEAVMRDDKPALRALLKQKADVNAPLVDGATALHWAAQSDDPETVDLLLAAGAKPNLKDRYGFTALYFACSNGNAAIVRK